MAAMASPLLREGLPYLMGKEQEEKEEEKTKKTCTQLACAGGRRMVSCVPMGGLHTGLLQSASVLMAACGRRVVRATARLRSSSRLRSLDCTKIASSLATHLSRRISMAALRGGRKKKEDGGEHKGRRGRKRTGTYDGDGGSSSSSEEEEDDGVWRRTILMGEKCQPLEFSGVIYYDGKGRRLRGPPRSPQRSPLPSFTFPAAVPSDKE